MVNRNAGLPHCGTSNMEVLTTLTQRCVKGILIQRSVGVSIAVPKLLRGCEPSVPGFTYGDTAPLLLIQTDYIYPRGLL